MLYRASGAEQRRQNILNGNIIKTLFSLSFPNMMYGVVQAVIPLTDSYFVNNCIGKMAGSAVAYSSSVIQMINGLALGIGVAATAVIGHENGKGNYKLTEKISIQLIVLVFYLGVLMMPVLLGLAFFAKSKVDAYISSDVFKYLSLNCFCLPFVYLETIYNSIKNTMGETEKPFIRMMMLFVLKLIFNYIFLEIFNLEIGGAVVATFLANVFITMWMIYDMFVSKYGNRYSFKGYRCDKEIIFQIFKIGMPSILNNFVLYLGFYMITIQIESYGATVLNGQGIANNIILICYTVPQAFAIGVTTMVSVNIGAENVQRAKRSCIFGNCASVITAIILGIGIILFADMYAQLFTKDQGVIEVVVEYLNICTLAVPAFGILMVNMGAFNGLGRTSLSLIIGILRVWVFRYAFMLVTDDLLGYHSMFWGDLFSNFICAFVTIYIAFNIKWKSKV